MSNPFFNHMSSFQPMQFDSIYFISFQYPQFYELINTLQLYLQRGAFKGVLDAIFHVVTSRQILGIILENKAFQKLKCQ